MKKVIYLILLIVSFSCSTNENSIDEQIIDEPSVTVNEIKEILQGGWTSKYKVANTSNLDHIDFVNNGSKYEIKARFEGDSIYLHNTADVNSQTYSYTKGKYFLKVQNDSVFFKKTYFVYGAQNTIIGTVTDQVFSHIKSLNENDILHSFFSNSRTEVEFYTKD